MAKKRARLSAKLGLALCSMLFALVLAEALTRLVGWINDVDYSLYRIELTNPDRLPARLFEWDELTGVRLRPGARVLATTSDFSVPYVINSRGLRDREYDNPKPPDRIRILALGDSLTFGEGVPYGKRFTDVAEASFDNLEILNAGVPGYGIDQSLVYLAAEGVTHSPDYVFVFVHGVQTRRHSTRIIRDGRVVLPRAMNTPRVGAQYVQPTDDNQRGWLVSHSDLFAYLSYRYAVAQLQERFAESDRRLWQRISGAGHRVNELTASKADWEQLFQRRTELLLHEIVTLGIDQGFETVVVGIGEYRALNYVEAVHPDLTYRSLTEELSAASERGNIRFKYDQHYNADTHEMLGTALANIICEATPRLSCGDRVVTQTPADPTVRSPPVAAGANANPPPVSPPTRVRDVVATTFVRRIYRGFLAREPSTAEIALWSKRVEVDAANRGHLVEHILGSKEYANQWGDQLFVISMYLGLFDRTPDIDGYNAHVASLAKGESAKRVLETWVSSQEWRKNYRRLDDAGVVTRLCRRMLRREPTATELDAWVAQLAAGDGAIIDLIVDVFYHHAEQRQRNAADLLPYQLSLGLTATLPAEREYQYWAGRLRLGEPRAAVIYDYVDYH